MLWPYLRTWNWDWIFGRAVKTIFSPGFRNPCLRLFDFENFSTLCIYSILPFAYSALQKQGQYQANIQFVFWMMGELGTLLCDLSKSELCNMTETGEMSSFSIIFVIYTSPDQPAL